MKFLFDELNPLKKDNYKIIGEIMTLEKGTSSTAKYARDLSKYWKASLKKIRFKQGHSSIWDIVPLSKCLDKGATENITVLYYVWQKILHIYVKNTYISSKLFPKAFWTSPNFLNSFQFKLCNFAKT